MGRNEEGEEHLRQRRQQLPFNLATGEGVLYDVFSFPGPPGAGPPGAGPPGPAEPTATEKPLDPASVLGSLHRQDHSIYTQSETLSPPQLPIFSELEDVDCDAQLQPLEQAFLDSHALLSVPGQMQTTLQKSPVTADDMMESLEQILGDIGDGGIEGLEVEETELRDWENTLFRVNKEREDVEMELNCSLANDVFSYVEEALRRETGAVVVQSPDQSLPVRGEHPGFSHREPRWHPVADTTTTSRSGFGAEAQLGNILVDVGNLTGLKGAAEVVSHRLTSTLTPTQCRKTLQGSHHCGNELSTQSCVTRQPWLPSTHNGDNIHTRHQSGSELMNQSVQYSQNHVGSQPRGPPVWQQQQQQQRQQLPQSFHHHTLSHSSLTPGSSVNSAAQPFHPQTQRLSGSCMYENREGHMPHAAAVPATHNGPLLGPANVAARASRNAPTFALSHPGIANQGVTSGSDVGSVNGLGHMRVTDADVGTFRPTEFPAENSSLQSSFFCWNGSAQVRRAFCCEKQLGLL